MRVEEVREATEKHNQQTIDILEEHNWAMLEETKQHNKNTLRIVKAQGLSIERLHGSLALQGEASEKTLSTTQSMYLIMTQIKNMVEALSRFVFDEQSGFMNPRFFAGPDPTLGKGIIIEDALGNIIPLNWGLVHSWEVRTRRCLQLSCLVLTRASSSMRS